MPADVADESLPGSIGVLLAVDQPGEQILVLFLQQTDVVLLLLGGQGGQPFPRERQQQQVQFQHTAAAVPDEFLIVDIC